MLNHMSSEGVFLGARTSVEAGGGRLSLGTHLQLHPQGCNVTADQTGLPKVREEPVHQRHGSLASGSVLLLLV